LSNSTNTSFHELDNFAKKAVLQNKELINFENITFEKVKIESDVMDLKSSANGILIVTMKDKENKNTFSEKFLQGFSEVFDHIKKCADYKAVILTGYDNYFSCGGTKEGLSIILNGEGKFTDFQIYTLPLDAEIPVIAAMQGHGIGGGLAIGMFCDEIIFSEESIYTANFMQYGFTPGTGATLIFPERLGYNFGKEILFSARQYKGLDLKEHGINYQVLPRNEVLNYAINLCNNLSLLSRQELIEMKKSASKELRSKIQDVFKKELIMHEKTFVGNNDVQERIEKFYKNSHDLEETKTDNEVHESMTLKDDQKKKDKEYLEIIKKKIRKVLGKELFLQEGQIEDDKSFIDMGMDSIIGVTFVKNIGIEFNLKVPATQIYSNPTINDLMQYVLKEGKKHGLFSDKEQKKEQRVEKNIVHNFGSPIKRKRRFENRFEFNKTKNEALGEMKQEETKIAIIGISGRYPNAKNIEEYWENLKYGKDCISEVPIDRWDWREYYSDDRTKPGNHNGKYGGFIDDIDKFDPLFFNISPKEAETIDPNERLFLETVWNLFESSGYTKKELLNKYQAKVGVYVGVMYQQYLSELNLSLFSSIANRISYYFNLQGPSIAIDTMCSSSIVAIHMACESLKRGETQLAVAGGVNLSIHPSKYLGLSMIQLLGSHPGCRSFNDGDGFLPAEGVGAVLLKPLSKAIQDNDNIMAVITSTSINNGGHGNGYKVPNLSMQAKIIEDNLKKSVIDPRTISYVEAATNGSSLGDVIEFDALNEVFKKYTNDINFCSIGSAKSNIGHAEAASGMSQLTKVILQMRHEKLVPTVIKTTINPNLDFNGSPFYLQREFEEWKRPIIKIEGKEKVYPRRALINSFGAGGTYANLIMEEYISESENNNSSALESKPQIMIFSAKNIDRLKVQIEQLLSFLENNSYVSLSDLAYTLQVGREEMQYRMAIIANNMVELKKSLKTYIDLKEEKKEIEMDAQFFLGDMKNNTIETKELFTSDITEYIIKDSLKNSQLTKLALLWTRGISIPWERIHENKNTKRITLPTYPFDKKRYWLTIRQDSFLNAINEVFDEKIDQESQSAITDNHPVVEIISKILGIENDKIDYNTPLIDYGFDSIFYTQLLHNIQTHIDPEFSFDKLQSCKTTQELINILPYVNSASQQSQIYKNKTYPELIHLNQIKHGKQVFWFHGGFGGVQIYRFIAKKSKRPFYGIEPKGMTTNESPIQGIKSMASHYIQIIRSVQPEGPYDLGGYSLGGTIAYEIARQLQESDQEIKTLTMIDTLYDPKIIINTDILDDTEENKKLIFKNSSLQIINMLLSAANVKENETYNQLLISRNEVDVSLDEPEFIKQLINHYLNRIKKVNKGLQKSESQIEDQLREMIIRFADVYIKFEAEKYSVLPLRKPDEICCYYFRNKSGLFMGEETSYFALISHRDDLSKTDYWKGWEEQMPNFHLMDVDSSSHTTMLNESKVVETILEFCGNLYSENGISAEYLNSFKKKVIEEHVKMNKAK
jgi:3-oxoacyl-(acyl-carrier-protein) synthase/thioesterase domain-containing protein/enoyl-CoA hydratase/carnithine racemase/acyl carrier protein